ncbi:hypothetical protein ACAW74_24725 [Fibrella sp. WM1]|uniref:hypothetical protein n=1 Tax=Fibrella musci TaxID=3242485 RepID=UPI003520B4E7
MANNTLVIVTGYKSISPRPIRKAYLNSSEDKATQRFVQAYPGIRDVTTVTITFEDEFTIRANGDIAPY